MDVNDDGIINIVDLVNLGIRFGEEGTPISKTELLLDLQTRVEALETELSVMNSSLANLEAKVNSMAIGCNVNWSSSPVQVQIFGSPPPHVPIPDMTVQITLTTTSFVRITVSAEHNSGAYPHWMRTLVDSTVANPGEISLSPTYPSAMYYSMDFFVPTLSSGVHTVEVQCRTTYAYPQDAFSIGKRALIVTAIPIQ